MAHTDPGAGLPVTVGVLLDSPTPSRWILDCVRQALSVNGVSLGPVMVVGTGAARSPSSRLHQLGERFAEPGRARRHRLFDPVDAGDELSRAPVAVDAAAGRDGWSPGRDLAQILQDSSIAVWLSFTSAPPRRRVASAARFGVWGLEIGRGVPAASAWAGAAELAGGSDITMTNVVDYAAAGEDPIYRSFGATVPGSVRANQLRAVHKGMSFFARLLEGAARTGRLPARPATLAVPETYPVMTSPTPGALARLSARLLAARTGKRVPSLRPRQWQIGYHFANDGDAGVRLDQLRYLVPPRDRFWADPIAVEHEGRHWVFFEELPYKARKGHLAAIEVFADRGPGPSTVVLERPYHLSYPFVFTWQDSWWMIPETAGNKTIEVYRCERLPDRWTLHSVLREGVNAFDATLWPDDGRWWMFVNLAEPGADACDELHLFSSETPLGPWLPHGDNPIVSDVRYARPAGPLYAQNGARYRPSQDDSRGYGHSVVISRVDALGPGGYRETIVDRVSPGWRSDVMRVHTLGAAGRLRVVDCMVERTRW